MKRYTFRSEYLKKNFSQSKLTFSIEKMRSDNLVLVKPSIQLYNSSKTHVKTYTGRWWVIGTKYQGNHFTFTIDDETLHNTTYYRVRLIVDNLSLDNRLRFNHMQLSEGTETNYHQPVATLPKTTVKFRNNFYANFYTESEDHFLQVIRPYYNNMDTETITKSKTTVLAPHLANEDDIDSPSNIGLEFMNQTDQVIEILR